VPIGEFLMPKLIEKDHHVEYDQRPGHHRKCPPHRIVIADWKEHRDLQRNWLSVVGCRFVLELNKRFELKVERIRNVSPPATEPPTDNRQPTTVLTQLPHFNFVLKTSK